jgi:hypothetical protein
MEQEHARQGRVPIERLDCDWTESREVGGELPARRAPLRVFAGKVVSLKPGYGERPVSLCRGPSTSMRDAP